jgi:hypothetical protein
MFDNASMLDLIERALDDDPLCPVCGAPNTIEDVNGRLWIVCSATIAPSGFLDRLTAAVLPHQRRLLVDLADHLAA